MATKVLLGGKLMFPTEYVAAIEFRGKDVSLTIAAVKLEDLKMQGGRAERKPVLSFKETKKRLILNRTNAGTIADLYGQKAEEWVGKKITLYPTRTQCGRETVDCIRIRERVREQAPPAPEMTQPFAEPEEPDVFGDPSPDPQPSADATPAAPASLAASPTLAEAAEAPAPDNQVEAALNAPHVAGKPISDGEAERIRRAEAVEAELFGKKKTKGSAVIAGR